MPELSLFKIADALQIPLKYENGVAVGEVLAQWGTLGATLQFKPKILKMFAAEQVGVLAHLMGDLYVVVSHFPKTNAVSGFLIDGSKLTRGKSKVTPQELIGKKMTIKEVTEALKAGVVAAYYWKGERWKSLRLPD